MQSIPLGLSMEKIFTVNESMLAGQVGSGSVDVLATPVMIVLMENVAAACIGGYISDEMTSVGTEVSITHCGATPVGMQVTIKASVMQVKNGKTIIFDLEARDEVEVVGKGTHTRVIVEREKFEKKAKSKGL